MHVSPWQRLSTFPSAKIWQNMISPHMNELWIIYKGSCCSLGIAQNWAIPFVLYHCLISQKKIQGYSTVSRVMTRLHNAIKQPHRVLQWRFNALLLQQLKFHSFHHFLMLQAHFNKAFHAHKLHGFLTVRVLMWMLVKYICTRSENNKSEFSVWVNL